jgi:hypothetical protein
MVYYSTNFSGISVASTSEFRAPAMFTTDLSSI